MRDFLVVVKIDRVIPDVNREKIQDYVEECIANDLPVVLGPDMSIEFMTYPKATAYTIPSISYTTGTNNDGVS